MGDLSDRRPVVVAVGQVTHKPAGGEDVRQPLDLMVAAARLAAADAGIGDAIWPELDAVRVINMLSWSYPRPPVTLATALGAPEPRVAVYTAVGGNSPQWQVNVAAEAIQAGREGLTLIAGAEALESARVAQKAGVPWVGRGWSGGRLGRPVSGSKRGGLGDDERAKASEAAPQSDQITGDQRPGLSAAEMSLGLMPPAAMYPFFENAIRAAAGRGLDDHRAVLGRLMARFSEVASTNPQAWFPDRRSAAQIATPSADNRMVGYPYTKLMNAIIRVDQGAALLLAPAGLARQLGVPEEQWVHVWSGAEANDVWFPFERPSLAASPGIGLVTGSAMNAAGIAIDDIACFDLYSCFPCAVEMACDALGVSLDDPRDLTVTGGLAAFGGPGNNYVTHSIAAMVDRLRTRPGEVGLVTGLGWYVTKHSAGVYCTEPPPAGSFTRASTTAGQASIDATALPSPEQGATGSGTVESYTVICDQAGAPARVPMLVRLDEGGRAVAEAHGDLGSYMEREVVGERGHLRDGIYEPA